MSIPILMPHDPSWKAQADRLAGELQAVLPDVAGVAHIGSTSIPGMAAKPIIDLQASVGDLDLAAAAFDPVLAKRGFVRLPYRHDHVPAGLDDDPERWAKRFWRRRGHDGPDVNLHVRLTGSPNERVALLFRDWFRSHPEAVPGYARFKTVLAAELPDLDGYTEVKDPVVDLIIAIAEPWATATGWRPLPA